mmetsp:Transcript_6321/g.13955  ORF Transcript_6321/g.13955 Transcript_6321/m.13955 type:complete len:212 (-) Transcript_6321:923-1558(-)
MEHNKDMVSGQPAVRGNDCDELLQPEAHRSSYVHLAKEPIKLYHNHWRLVLFREDIFATGVVLLDPHGGVRLLWRLHGLALLPGGLHVAAAQLHLHISLRAVPQRDDGQGGAIHHLQGAHDRVQHGILQQPAVNWPNPDSDAGVWRGHHAAHPGGPHQPGVHHRGPGGGPAGLWHQLHKPLVHVSDHCHRVQPHRLSQQDPGGSGRHPALC